MTGAAVRRGPGWWYPWIFVGCMLLVVVVNGVLAYLAVSSWTGLDTEDYYRKGLAYNETIAAAAAQDARGWQMNLAITPEKGDQGRPLAALTAAFSDRSGHSIEDLRVRAVFKRPTREGADVSFSLSHEGEGMYGGRIPVPLSGQWDVWVVASRHGESLFQGSRRVFLP